MDERGLLDYRKNASFTLYQSFIHTRDRRPSKPLVYKLQETRMKERFPLDVMDFAALVPDALLPPTSGASGSSGLRRGQKHFSTIRT